MILGADDVGLGLFFCEVSAFALVVEGTGLSFGSEVESMATSSGLSLSDGRIY